MQTLRSVFFALAALCFLLAALEIKAPRMDLSAAGLLFFTLAIALSGGAS